MKNINLIAIVLSIFLTSCASNNVPAKIRYGANNISDYEKINEDYIEVIQPYGDIDIDHIIPEDVMHHDPGTYHEVKPNEQIEDIAAKYGLSLEEIASMNNLSKPYKVVAYQSLKVNKEDDPIAKEFAPDAPIENKPEVKFEEKKQVEVKPIPTKASAFILPLEGEVISKFGSSSAYGKNKGINIAAKKGAKVVASASGTVIYAEYDATFGNLVMIKTLDNNHITAYAHLEDIILRKNAKIEQGGIIGYAGSSGKVATAQLHFAIRKGKEAIDPLKLIK